MCTIQYRSLLFVCESERFGAFRLRSHGTGTWSTSKVLDATDVNNIEMLTWLYSLGCKCNSIAYRTNVLYSPKIDDVYDFDDFDDDDDDDDDDK